MQVFSYKVLGSWGGFGVAWRCCAHEWQAEGGRKDQTPHFTPQHRAPRPYGAVSPPKTRRDLYRAKRTASLQLTLLTPQSSGHLPPTPMGQKARNLQPA